MTFQMLVGDMSGIYFHRAALLNGKEKQEKLCIFISPAFLEETSIPTKSLQDLKADFFPFLSRRIEIFWNLFPQIE